MQRRRRKSFETSFPEIEDTELSQIESCRKQRAIEDRIALLVWTIAGSIILGVLGWLG